MNKPKIIVICGPTASGKTALSIELAKKINGEIVSADSMQIYKDMNIGTAKPTIQEQDGIKHYLMDYVSPEKRYSVAEYKKDAINAIEEILKNKKVPIIVGGTGLYIDSVVKGIEYNEINTDLNYRKELDKIAESEGFEYLYQKAKSIDEEAMKKISHNDKKRIFRVLELYKATGKTKTQLEIESREKENPYEFTIFGIETEREKLYNRINARVDNMIKQGLIKEVEEIIIKYNSFPTAMQGLGYKEVKEYLDGILTKEEMTEKIKMETRRYAKRQMTWFRRNKEIIWLKGVENKEELQKNIDIILEVLK